MKKNDLGRILEKIENEKIEKEQMEWKERQRAIGNQVQAFSRSVEEYIAGRKNGYGQFCGTAEEFKAAMQALVNTLEEGA